MRQKKREKSQILYASDPVTLGLPAAIRGLFYDFHCLMNDEIIFDFVPKYILEKNFDITEEELTELDDLAELMLDPDKNFDDLVSVWEKNLKLRIMAGGLN